MNYTENYQLRKPAANDNYSVDDANFNADRVDAELAAREGLLKNRSTKDTPVDADGVPLIDSAASSATKRITWAKIKAALKTYFDLLYAAVAHTHAAGDITSGVLPVANGGTGRSTFTSGNVLTGNGTSAVGHRAIKHNTSTTDTISATNSLITESTLRYALNRSTSVYAGDTTYGAYMVRGTSLGATERNPSANGQIAWTYE